VTGGGRHNRDALFAELKPKFVPHHPDQPHLVLHSTSTRRRRQRRQRRRVPASTYTYIHTQPTNRQRGKTRRPHPLRYLTTPLDDADQMPGLHWPFVLAPLPPRKKKRVQPGFTDEELLYLEEVLALVRPLLSLYLHPC